VRAVGSFNRARVVAKKIGRRRKQCDGAHFISGYTSATQRPYLQAFCRETHVEITRVVSHLVATLPLALAPMVFTALLSAMVDMVVAISGVIPVPWPPANTHFAAATGMLVPATIAMNAAPATSDDLSFMLKTPLSGTA
jgi:hypothetical protein